ncbi:MAG TPA: phage tail protein [Pyrinomonadaceae bacterium]|nr:phage tail protein [Pyrinomonadaceae bacterium]
MLNNRGAWEEGVPVNLSVSDEGLKISSSTEYTTDLEVELDKLGGVLTLTDFAVAECSMLYFLDGEERAIWLYEPRQKYFERLDCFDLPFKKPTSITYAPGNFFVADTEGEQRVYALAAVNWQVRWTIPPEPVSADKTLKLTKPFEPIDLAVDSDGNLYALDQSNLAVLKFDAEGNLISIIGESELGTAKPVSIAVALNKSLYVLDTLQGKVLRFDTHDGTLEDADFIVFQEWIDKGRLPAEFEASVIATDSRGNIYVGDRHALGSNQEDDRFISIFDGNGQYAGEVVGFRGAALQLVVDAENRIYVFNKEAATSDTAAKERLVVLKPLEKFLKLSGTSLVAGTYFSHSFDSAASGNTWHKFVLDASLPENTQLRVSYLIGEERGATDALLQDETKPLTDKNNLGWSSPVVNASDALIRGGEGRYLWLKIEFIGSEFSSPLLKSVRVEFPRVSYLRYLPAVYQDDERSRDFLERFLSVFETFFGAMERQIDHIARLFDPEAARGAQDFLHWIGSWLAIAVDKNWSDERLRKLITRAPELYKKRGTRAGIEEIIEIYTGERPIIVERFQLECEDAAANLDGVKILRALFEADPYCFCVLLKPFQLRGEDDRRALNRILKSEKPAHTCAGLLSLQPWIYLDMHTYLDINTYLSEPDMRLDLGGAMPHDTVLTDAEDSGQIERRSRLNIDMTLS